ncbi:MAG: hypothetical protein JNM70_16710 [Anaerolineae bacterium]|nr:hypothetical protein [Anaerolineae bacterium]
MSTSPSIEDSLQTERELIEAIKRTSRRRSLPMLGRFALTLILPYLVFMGLWLLGDTVRAYVDVTFGQSFLNFTTALSTLLVLFMGTWVVWRWSEKRFGGLALVRRLLGISRSVLAVDEAIDALKAQADPAPEAIRQVQEMAYQVWDQYLKAMDDSGMPIQDGELNA